jgi:hypothetical protein
MVTVYQPKGKGHIQYINRSAKRIWKDNYQCIVGTWEQSLKDAMEIHRSYLITGMKMTKQEIEYRNSREKVKRAGIWWKNETTGEWENIGA